MEGNIGPMTCSLEAGNILTKPIGYIESCFNTKNGTPRQPSVCSLSRACLRISKSVFNNPEHSVMGLEEFSHVWILFVFHKNGRLSFKAKVKPPRLNGAKTGVFSTRSPHRPNAIGLTLARLEKVEGGTLYLSGIDMIEGTPVLDIKPHISEYDSPKATVLFPEDLEGKDRKHNAGTDKLETTFTAIGNPQAISQELPNEKYPNPEREPDTCMSEMPIIPAETPEEIKNGKDFEITSASSSLVIEHQNTCNGDVPSQFADYLTVAKQGPEDRHQCDDGDPSQPLDYLTVADKMHELTRKGVTERPENRNPCNPDDTFVPTWIKDAPVANLKVRFTPHSEMELRHFKQCCDSGGPSFRYFKSFDEAKYAISTVLSADPRSVYRRKQCQDRLFYFSLDTIHITCWFGDGFAEVLRIQPHKAHAECSK
ncbi:tRNA (adenine(37)-N6)-methyltransferase [Pelobates fuscus]|uniref:tRNA (adenine(37)-N6)-methyltransferase n=1 Tax=Pelobates fuscus TaxID=191477 RepID=UPI002FE487BD